MRLAPEIAESVGVIAERWAESTSDLPLIIRKTPDGAVCAQALPRQRFTKGQFAQELNMGRNKFRAIEAHFGLEPASDGLYDAETVETVRRWLRNEEAAKRAPRDRRVA